MSLVGSACALDVLLGLSVTVLRALSGLADVYIAQMQALVTQLQAQLVTARLALVPVQLAFGVVDAALQQANSIANLLPVSAFEGCADIGDFMGDRLDGIDEATRDLQELKMDITRKLSAVDELEARIAEANAALDELNVFKTLLAEAEAAKQGGA